MPNFADAFTYIYQYFDNIGFLILASVGLILIFGMMGVINMAHGELMMIGAYITAFAYHAGVPAPIAILLAGDWRRTRRNCSGAFDRSPFLQSTTVFIGSHVGPKPNAEPGISAHLWPLGAERSNAVRWLLRG